MAMKNIQFYVSWVVFHAKQQNLYHAMEVLSCHSLRKVQTLILLKMFGFM